MRTRIASPLAETAAGAIAADVIRSCVHCGMCNATCPTYHLTGDEMDGPRGRIYLIKQALEGEPVTRLTQSHLDRCLSCRACETTCPSGVEYHRLLDVGREAVAQQLQRPLWEGLVRRAIRAICLQPWRLATLVTLGRPFKFGLPAALSGKLPRKVAIGRRPKGVRSRQMSLLKGCVQSATAPHINAANERVFDSIDISLRESKGINCCGALSFHLDAPEEGRALARRNIDIWLAEIDAGSEAVIVNASGCAAFIRDYPDILAEDSVYRDRARRVIAYLKDPIEILANAGLKPSRAPKAPRIAVHQSCTLRNGPGLGGEPAKLLRQLGYEPQPIKDSHLCCGSAGAYSLLQPSLANSLRKEKVTALTIGNPEVIYTANIGCWMHLGESSPVPVRHWLEAIDDII